MSPPFTTSSQPPYRIVKASGGDDYAAAQAALNACVADGKELLIQGKLRLSAGLVATDVGGLGLSIRGISPLSGFEPYNAAADTADLLTLNGRTVANAIAVRDLLFTNRSGVTPGTAGGGAGLVIGSQWGVRVENCTFQYVKNSLIVGSTWTPGAPDAVGAQVTHLENIKIVGPHFNAGVAIWLKGSTEVCMRDVLAVCGAITPPANSIALLIESRDAIEVSHFDCVRYDIGCKIKPNGTSLNINGGMWFWNCMTDTGNKGWVVDGSGENLDAIECHGCWASYNTGLGVELIGSDLSGFRWIGGIVQANLGGGIKVSGGTDHGFQDAMITGNGGAGIELAAGVDDIAIQGCTISDRVGYGTKFSDQLYGIKGNGGHNGIRIQNNDLRFNDTASTTGDLTGTDNRIQGNLGLNPKGNLTAPTVPASSIPYTNNLGYDCTVFVNGGTVSAVAIGGTSTGQVGGMFRVPAGQTITLTYSVAPTWTWFGD